MHPALTEVKTAIVKDGKCILSVIVRPNSPSTQVKDIRSDGSLKIDLSEPPANGRANRELVLFLSKLLGLSSTQVQIIRGTSQSHKLVLITLK